MNRFPAAQIRLAALAFAVLVGITVLLAPAGTGAQAASAPGEAHEIFARSKDALLQLRTIHTVTKAQASTGSGFIATADGLVISNYHVVSQHALEPERYQIEFVRGDDSRGRLELLAVDIVNDLALLRMPGQKLPHLRLRPGSLAKGDRGYAMGNPRGVGMTIVEGTYNGISERHDGGRLHFTGAINAGMSGGPAVDRDGTVFGINVAALRSSELVSFLVPAEHAARLIERFARATFDPERVRKDIARQLLEHQTALMQRTLASPLPTSPVSHYVAPDALPGLQRCWGDSANDEQWLYTVDTKGCVSEAELFVSPSLTIRTVTFRHKVLRSDVLGAVRFPAIVESFYAQREADSWATPDDVTQFRCHDDFINLHGGTVRTALCVRAYRKFAGLYDFRLRLATLEAPGEALVSALELDAVDFEGGTRFAQRYIEATSWNH